MAYFRCTSGSGGGGATITVTYDSSFYNKTITCSDGTTTYTKTTTSSGSTEFSVKDEGTWTIVCDGVSRTVNVVLNYSTQLMITKTFTVYGAVGATISFTDAVGSKTVTTDGSGQGSVSISFLPPSYSITFTSSVAKDPDNLSADYTKTVAITNNMTDVYIMPDNALYWYGYNNPSNPMIDASSANGWTAWNSGFRAPSYNTNDIYVMATGSGTYSAVANTNAVTATTIHAISQVTSQGGINVSASKALNDSVFITRFAQGTTLAHNQQTISTQAVYIAPFGVNGNGRGVYLYAIWYE